VNHDGRARIDLDDLRKSLLALMWRRMGITRDQAGLDEAGAQVDRWCRYVLPQVFDDPAGWAMQNMLITARCMIAAAAHRKESRGVHSRSDFPQSDPSWNHHITLKCPPVRTKESGLGPEPSKTESSRRR
jgi:L-aspartate oxidase